MEQPRVQLLHDTFFDFAPAPVDLQGRRAAGPGLPQRNSPAASPVRSRREERREVSLLQRELLPRMLPEVHNALIDVWSRSSGAVGGDLYDVFRINSSRVGFWIVDATGHSWSSALLASLARGVLGSYARLRGRSEGYDPLEALGLLNIELLGHDFSDCFFVAALCGTYDEATRELHWVRAGTPPPLMIDSSGHMRRAASDGTVLGMMERPSHAPMRHVLASGEKISFFTDGLEELPLDWIKVLREASLCTANGDRPAPARDFFRLSAILDGMNRKEPLADDVTVLTFCAL